MSKELLQIENVSETAYRFSSILKFLPGQITTIAADELKTKPAIQLLIDNGTFKVVGGKNEKADDIEEV